MTGVAQLVRVLGIAVGACIAVKVLAWLVTPVLPLLVGLFVLAGVWTLVTGHHRQ